MVAWSRGPEPVESCLTCEREGAEAAVRRMILPKKVNSIGPPIFPDNEPKVLGTDLLLACCREYIVW
jgi:hypothetical protein